MMLWKRTTNKLSPCFVPVFPVWAKIVIDTVVFFMLRLHRGEREMGGV